MLRYLFFYSIIALSGFANGQVPDSILIESIAITNSETITINKELLNSLEALDCAHGHVCCASGCHCCSEMFRDQIYSTESAPPIDGITRLTTIEGYQLAMGHMPGPIKYEFKNDDEEVVAVYYNAKATDISYGSSNYARLEWYHTVSDFESGYELVFDSEFDYSLINAKGETLPIDFHSKEELFPNLFKVSIVSNGKRIYGLSDGKGNKIGGLQYIHFGAFSDRGLAIVSKSRFGGFGIIDLKGDTIIGFNYHEIEALSDDYFAVQGSQGWQLVNAEGNIITSKGYIRMGELSEGLIMVEDKHNKIGFIDTEGNEIIEPQFFWAEPFNNDRAAVTIDDKWEKWGFIDKSGELVIPYRYDRVNDFNSNRATVQVGKGKESKWGVINKSGSYVVEPVYDNLSTYKDGISIATVYGKGRGNGLIDTKGKEVVPPKFVVKSFGDKNSFFVNDRILLRTLDSINRYFLADRKGNEIVRLDNYDFVNFVQYLEIETKVMPFLMLSKEGKRGMVDIEGNEVLKCKYDKIYHQYKNVFILHLGNDIYTFDLESRVLKKIWKEDLKYYFTDGLGIAEPEKYHLLYLTMDGNKIEGCHPLK